MHQIFDPTFQKDSANSLDVVQIGKYLKNLL